MVFFVQVNPPLIANTYNTYSKEVYILIIEMPVKVILVIFDLFSGKYYSIVFHCVIQYVTENLMLIRY